MKTPKHTMARRFCFIHRSHNEPSTVDCYPLLFNAIAHLSQPNNSCMFAPSFRNSSSQAQPLPPCLECKNGETDGKEGRPHIEECSFPCGNHSQKLLLIHEMPLTMTRRLSLLSQVLIHCEHVLISIHILLIHFPKFLIGLHGLPRSLTI